MSSIQDASPNRLFRIIRHDGEVSVDAERFVPGKIIARCEKEDHIAITYRYGERYFKRVIYKTPAAAAENLKDWFHEAQERNQAEWSHLQWIVGKTQGRGSTTRGGSERDDNEEEVPRKEVTEEERQIYGHKWKLEEIRKEFSDFIDEGEQLVAFQSKRMAPSQIGDWSWNNGNEAWEHHALFRTKAVSAIGNVLFRWVAVREDESCRLEKRISTRTAECWYRDMKIKVAELGPLKGVAR